MLVPSNIGSCSKILVIFPKFDTFSGVFFLKCQYKFSHIKLMVFKNETTSAEHIYIYMAYTFKAILKALTY